MGLFGVFDKGLGMLGGIAAAAGPALLQEYEAKRANKQMLDLAAASPEVANAFANLQQNQLTASAGSELPAAVRTAQWLERATPEQRELYRLGQGQGYKIVDIGGQQVIVDAITGQPMGNLNKTLAPGDTPQVRLEQARSTEIGKAAGAAESDLITKTASFPALQSSIEQLISFAPEATFTPAGRAADYALNAAGFETEGAKARASYIAQVRNTILPQLKATFGAQFTALEGDKLEQTLGDPNKGPEQKIAAIKLFYDTAKKALETAQRASQLYDTMAVAPSAPAASGAINFNDLPE